MIRTLAAGQYSRVLMGGPDDAEPVELFRSDRVLFEAPNWSRDGRSLYLNGDGLLWRLEMANPREPQPIEFTGLPPINNDHVLDPDGEHIFLSANDGHIYRGSLSGGE
ncbi:MAG: biopolymer transporter Tol, partial [Mycetocola sp.]